MSPVGEGLNAARLQGGLTTPDPRAAAGDAIDPQILRMNFAMGSPNPFRPIEDIQVAREILAIACPSAVCTRQSSEAAVFLHPVSQNEHGDILLTCGNWACGYETVLRVATRTFEPRPGRPTEGFVAPELPSQRKQPVTKAPATRRPQTAKLLTLAQAAEQSGLPLRSLRRAVRKGKLRALKRDGEYRVNPVDLTAYQQEIA